MSAQNLVVNGGLEERGQGGKIVRDDGFTTNLVTGWFLPTNGSADYYCAVQSQNHPFIPMSNYFGGTAKPYQGNSFAGFYAYTQGSEYREYVGGTLTQPLVAAGHYRISMALLLGPKSKLSVESLGAFFSAEKVNEPSAPFLKQTAQANFKITWTDDSLSEWKIVTADFVAAGGERYFTIGNFFPDKTTVTNPINAGEKSGFFFAYYYMDQVSVELTNGSTYIAPGTKLVAQNILFETNKSDLKATSYPPLYQILAALKAQPNLKVEIDGHTDNVGNADANQKLSEARAKAVADFFIANGISANRITSKGFGSSKPIGDDNNKNRRVEFIFSE